MPGARAPVDLELHGSRRCFSLNCFDPQTRSIREDQLATIAGCRAGIALAVVIPVLAPVAGRRIRSYFLCEGHCE